MSLRLEDLKKDAVLKGVIPSQNVRVVSADPIGPDAVTLTYRDAENKLGERMLFRPDEAVLDLVTEGRPWSFDGDGADFKLAAEAHRIHLAHLFDPLMAVHTSNLEPLPHVFKQSETAGEGTSSTGWETFLEAGETAAGAMLARIREKAEPIRQLAYRLYTLCERTGRAEEARSYNELVMSWYAITEASHRVEGPLQMGLL